jgi:hypothetical protein
LHFIRGYRLEAKDMLSLPDDEFRAHVVEYLVAHDAAIAENTAVTRSVQTKTDQVAEDTAFIRSILADVAAGARLLCRLAAAWKFLVRQVFVPVVLPLAALWAMVRIIHHEAVPDVFSAALKLIGGLM